MHIILTLSTLAWETRRPQSVTTEFEGRKKERHWRDMKAGAADEQRETELREERGKTNEKAWDVQRSPGLAGQSVTQDRKYHAQAVARGKSPGSIKINGICLYSGNPEICATRTKCDCTVRLMCSNGPIIMVRYSVIRVGLASLTQPTRSCKVCRADVRLDCRRTWLAFVTETCAKQSNGLS